MLQFLNSASFVMSNLFPVPFRVSIDGICLNASSGFTLYSDPRFCMTTYKYTIIIYYILTVIMKWF